MTGEKMTDGQQQERKRRVRYRGTHPRRFEEKYKELSPQRYADTIKKVMERGQTPAGMHRPICVREVLDLLDPKPGMTGLDATLGYGGHAQELLRRILPGGKLFAIDVDPIELPRTERRLRDMGFTPEVLVIRRMNFAGLPQLLPQAGAGFDFILADLGVSSMQIDTPSRGFSFKVDGPLDLRLNPLKGMPASKLIRTLDPQTLTALLFENADEPHAQAIAQAIVTNRDTIFTTKELASVISRALRHLPEAYRAAEIRKSRQRTFQALRIAVNDEFRVLDQFLDLLPEALKTGGKVAIITFHSGEDRRVKKSFQKGVRNGLYARFAREPIRPSPEEQRTNPRSSCAKLRWAEKQ